MEIVIRQDITSVSRWHKKDEAPDVLICSTIGWVLKEDENTLWIYGTISEDDQIKDSMAIPKGTILKRRKLRTK